MSSFNKLIARMGIAFVNLRLLESALTHRSFSHEHPDQALLLMNNERLEFLGDSVLNYVAADLVFDRFPDKSEGELTLLRVALIKTTTLAGFARELDLGSFIRLSKGEESSGARNRDALLADTFEALIAAVYLDRGMEGVRAFVLPFFERQVEQIAVSGLVLDYKSQLQRQVQAMRGVTPAYRVVAEAGPEHRREYTVEVLAGDEALGVGQGFGKQAATQDAARVALEKFNQSNVR